MGKEAQRDFQDAISAVSGKVILAKHAMDATIEAHGRVDFSVAQAVLDALKEVDHILESEVFPPLNEYSAEILAAIANGQRTAA